VQPSSKIKLRDIILGGQDGLVNVLGISLGLFTAHASTRIILVAGLAAGFSEAVSMGAVAFTSARADKEKTTGQLIFSSFIVLLSALIGSLAPLVPFLFFSPLHSVILAVIIGAIILFILGLTNARSMGNNKLRGGLEILLIGLISAFAGFAIGLVLKVA
jgi:vacuolar iron transporter family protein